MPVSDIAFIGKLQRLEIALVNANATPAMRALVTQILELSGLDHAIATAEAWRVVK